MYNYGICWIRRDIEECKNHSCIIGLYNPYNNDLFGINAFEREENFEYGKLIKFRKPPHFRHNL